MAVGLFAEISYWVTFSSRVVLLKCFGAFQAFRNREILVMLNLPRLGIFVAHKNATKVDNILRFLGFQQEFEKFKSGNSSRSYGFRKRERLFGSPDTFHDLNQIEYFLKFEIF